VLPVFGD